MIFQIDFHYKKTNFPLLILVIIGGMGLALMFIGIKSLTMINPDDSADTVVFMSLGLVFIVLGLPFLIYGLMYFGRNNRFYANQLWTGIRIDNQTLTHCYFNNWKIVKQSIELKQLEHVEADSYKGQKFLRCRLSKHPKTLNLSCNKLSIDEMKQVLAQINYFKTLIPPSI